MCEHFQLLCSLNFASKFCILGFSPSLTNVNWKKKELVDAVLPRWPRARAGMSMLQCTPQAAARACAQACAHAGLSWGCNQQQNNVPVKTLAYFLQPHCFPFAYEWIHVLGNGWVIPGKGVK